MAGFLTTGLLANWTTGGIPSFDQPALDVDAPPPASKPASSKIQRVPSFHPPESRHVLKRRAEINFAAPPLAALQRSLTDLHHPMTDCTSMQICLNGPSSENWQDWVTRELDDPRRMTIPILHPRFLSHLEPERLAQFVREVIVRIRTMTASGNEHLLRGDLSAFERVSWMTAPDAVPLLISEASRLNAIHPDRYPGLLESMLDEYSRHETDLRFKMATIRNQLKLK